MKITLKTTPSEEGQVILDSLQKAVTQALEKKRRLGQYAVVWRDGEAAKMRRNLLKIPFDSSGEVWCLIGRIKQESK